MFRSSLRTWSDYVNNIFYIIEQLFLSTPSYEGDILTPNLGLLPLGADRLDRQ